MVRKCLLIGLALILLITLGSVIGCGGGGSPEAVVKDFFAAINAGEVEKAEGYIYSSLSTPFPKELKGKIERLEILDVATFPGRGAEVTTIAHVRVKLIVSTTAPFISASRVWSQENIKTITLGKTEQGWKVVGIL